MADENFPERTVQRAFLRVSMDYLRDALLLPDDVRICFVYSDALNCNQNDCLLLISAPKIVDHAGPGIPYVRGVMRRREDRSAAFERFEKINA